MIQFDWSQVVGPTPTPTPTASTPAPSPVWSGQYFDNPDLHGDPVFAQEYVGEELNLNWGEGSPDPSVPADNFSARWTQIRWFSAGNYRFHLTVDDGARVWVGDHLLIDAWEGGPYGDVTGDIYLDQGMHAVKVEFVEVTVEARIHVWTEPLGR